jgi:mannose-6-phosphate isomerase-like protein (cupin superfamily)
MFDQVKFVYKDWGYEKIIENNDLYCGKILFIKKGHCISLQYHKIKDETFYVLDGDLLAKFAESSNLLNFEEIIPVKMGQGDVRRIRPGEVHQLYAVEDSMIIEVSTTHFDEDTYRITKKFF